MAVSFVDLDAAFTTGSGPVTGLGGGITGAADGDIGVVHLSEFATGTQTLVIVTNTGASGWTLLNSGTELDNDGPGSNNSKQYLGTNTRNATAWDIDVDASSGNYHVAALLLFRNAAEPTVYATAIRDDNTNAVVIPAFNVADAGSMAFLAVNGYASDVGVTPFTNEGWTHVGSNDDNWTRYFTKAVSSNQTAVTTTETDTDSWFATVAVIPPAAGGESKSTTGATSLALAASGATADPAKSTTGAPSLALAASGATADPAKSTTGAPSLALAASGTTADPTKTAVGAAALALAAAAAAAKSGAAVGTSPLVLAASSDADKIGDATGATAMSLNASGTVTKDESTVPGTITDLAATPGDTEVVLTWTAPSDGGDPITDYVVEYRDTP